MTRNKPLEVIVGGVRYDVWACRNVLGVAMANEEDPYHVMWFTSRDQIDAFVRRLQTAANEAFDK